MWLFIVLALLFVFLFWIWHQEDLIVPPGPPKLPIVGNLLQISRIDHMPHKALIKLGRKYGGIMSIKIGSMDAIVLSSYKAIRELLPNRALNDRILDGVIQDRNMGQNLGINWSNGPIWFKMRRFMTKSLHAFGVDDLPFLQNILATQLNQLLEQIEKTSGPICLDGQLKEVGMRVMWSLLMGQDSLEHLNPENFAQFVELSSEFDKATNLGSSTTIAFPILRTCFPIWSGRKWVLKASEKLNGFIKEIISERTYQPDLLIGSFFDKFLAKIKLGNDPDFSPDQLTICILDMLQGGGDTMAAILSFSIFYLTKHQNVQHNLQVEIDKVIGVSSQITLQHKYGMKYTEAVLLEIIRHGVVLPIPAARKVTKDFKYEGYNFKKGTAIMANIYAVFRDPDLWEKPEKFCPERFLDKKGRLCRVTTNIVKNIAFGAGVRMCPAMKLANNWLFFYLTSMNQKFEFLPAPKENYNKVEPILGMTLAPKPFKVVVKSRSATVCIGA